MYMPGNEQPRQRRQFVTTAEAARAVHKSVQTILHLIHHTLETDPKAAEHIQ